MHEDPQVLNYIEPGYPGYLLKPGMVIAIEPMVNMGTKETRVLADGWTVVTDEGSYSANFEHQWLSPRKMQRYNYFPKYPRHFYDLCRHNCRLAAECRPTPLPLIARNNAAIITQQRRRARHGCRSMHSLVAREKS
jgi:hypothetical protein